MPRTGLLVPRDVQAFTAVGNFANAKAAEKRAKAAAESSYKGTIKAKTESRVADAEADFMVAKGRVRYQGRH